ILVAGLICSSCTSSAPAAGKEETPSTVSASTKSADGHFYRLKLARLMDNQGFGQPVEVAHMLVPTDWRTDGQVQWANNQIRCPTNIIHPHFTANGSDGTGLEITPGYYWPSASDPMMMQTMRQAAASGTGCDVGPVVNSIQYLEQTIVPRLRPGARITARKPL